MNIVDYVNKYGSSDFRMKPFNNVDAAVFVSLSYLDFDKIAPSVFNATDSISFHDITDEQTELISALASIGEQKKSLIISAKDSLRYRDVEVSFVMNVKDNVFLEQFFAVTFKIPDVGYFVAFRGTDGSIIGWKENFTIAVQGATASQLDSVEYLNILHRYLGDVPLIIGGHSKGGNLAFYATLYSPDEINKNIIRSYSFDGTGFFTKQYRDQKAYKIHLPHMIQIVPQDSVVGEIFYTPNNHTVIYSNAKGMKQHNPFTWEVDDDGEFVSVQKRTFKSRVFHRAMKKWTQNGTKEEKTLFIDVLFTALADENGNFAAFGNGDSSLKKITGTIKTMCTTREKVRFYLFTLKLGLYYFSSFIYYLFKK